MIYKLLELRNGSIKRKIDVIFGQGVTNSNYLLSDLIEWQKSLEQGKQDDSGLNNLYSCGLL